LLPVWADTVQRKLWKFNRIAPLAQFLLRTPRLSTQEKEF
jgi:hypothetical protein